MVSYPSIDLVPRERRDEAVLNSCVLNLSGSIVLPSSSVMWTNVKKSTVDCMIKVIALSHRIRADDSN